MRRRASRGLGIGLAAALVLAFIGALGTDAAPFGQRLAYWACVILPGSVLGLIFTALVRQWGGFARHAWAEIVVVAIAVSLPHTFVVVVASALFFGISAITPGLVASFGGAVLVLALVLTAINFLVAASHPVVPQAAPLQPAPAPEPAPASGHSPTLPPLPDLIAEKLPVRLRAARLIAIEAEDHYLRIHTDGGSELVLMRMGDACALLGEGLGARVHRSWWVARAAVTARMVQGGRMELALENGLRAPVARAMQPRLREEGWGSPA